MKEIKRNVVTETQKTLYVADDGREFEKRDACIWYEKSAEFNKKFETVEFYDEINCNRYYAYKLSSNEDYELVKASYCYSRCRWECNKNTAAWKFPITIFVQDNCSGDYNIATVYLASDLLAEVDETIEDANNFKDFINSNK